MSFLPEFGVWAYLLTTVGVLAVAAAIFRIGNVVRFIPNDRLAVVEKSWSVKGSVNGGLIALNGEAGFQPDVLRGGLHVFFPFQFRIHTSSLVTIPQGQIGYVFARDGLALPPTQTLASNDKASDFQDVRAFLAAGGQKGPQRKILRDGVYAFNLAQFVVFTEDTIYAINLSDEDKKTFANMADMIKGRKGFSPVVIKDRDDKIGVVTVHDGPSLPTGEIIAPAVGSVSDELNFHNNFQNPEAFLLAGGNRGRQLQVLVDGTYYINALFATIELIDKTTIEVGWVGVVVSYIGKKGADTSGEEYRHGELVDVGYRGVWNAPLLPGKYAFNTYAGKITQIPTTNFVLKWTAGVVGSHKFDENLTEVSLITKDAFEPVMPLSVVVHIDYKKAPLVVQRFGDIKKLVDQTLDPMVSAYFKNIAQTKTLIELLQERADIQAKSGDDMRMKFLNYSLELQEVLIGTPRSANDNNDIEPILNQLRERQIAVEMKGTYLLKEAAAVQERSLREMEARAKQQTGITESEMQITMQENEGKARLAAAQQEATQIKVLADAEAAKIVALGTAEANRTEMVGLAAAKATEAQVAAYGGPQYQLASTVLTRFAEAVENGRIPLVPQIVSGGNGEGASVSGALEGLLALTMSEKLGAIAPKASLDGKVE